MSTSDQAKSKLLDSMRASKEGAKETPVAKKAEPVQKAAPAKKAVAAKKPKAATTKKATTNKAAKPAAAKAKVSDSFQAAQRVWPD
jgi:hypothetical protein